MERLAPDIRVSCNASVLPNLGDQLWHISNDVDEKERMYGTILRSTATQTWVIRLDYDDSLVVMKSHQLQNESGLRGICEVISVDYDDSLGTESQLFDDSVTSVTADEAETVEVGGVVWHYTPGQQCKTDSSRLEGRARPTVEGVNFSLKMDLDEGFWKFFPFTPQHICDHVNPILKEHKKRETTEKEVVTWFALFIGASLYGETCAYCPIPIQLPFVLNSHSILSWRVQCARAPRHSKPATAPAARAAALSHPGGLGAACPPAAQGRGPPAMLSQGRN
jgi:hypothetical protein